MPQALNLHHPPKTSALNHNPLKPHFEDEELEEAWHLQRIDRFRKVNQRAVAVIIVINIIFLILILNLDAPNHLPQRFGCILFLSFFWFLIGKVDSASKGDFIILIGGSITHVMIWFLIFMNQDSYAIEHLWLVTAAMSILASFMLIEATNLIKILLAAVSIVVASSAPVFLEVEMLEYIIYLVHLLVITLISWVASWQVEMGRREAFARRLGVEIERERTVDLLRNILPESIANQLLSKPGTIAERHERVAVLFADIVEFTPWTATQEPQKVVATLDQIFSEFDRLCDRYGVEKIKTIGDAYMAAGGVPQGSQAEVQDVVRLALEMLEVVQQIPNSSAKSVRIRIGVHQGPVIAGVIGQRKFIYDLWGDTVNTAARMESHGIAGRLQVTEIVAKQLNDEFLVESRGSIEIKGKGPLPVFLVNRRNESSSSVQ